MGKKKMSEILSVEPGKKFHIDKWDPDFTSDIKDKETGLAILQKNQKKLGELQYRLYAENKHALLVILQGMDASGKDGTVRHVMYGVNPQVCSVTSFKAPTSVELEHDYLWRVHQQIPARGEIGIFNRSHYEDVLIVRVHDLVPKAVWSKRYEQINNFEKMLTENNVTVLKFFIHISADEQKRRLQERLDDPTKNWKMNPEDVKERMRWDDYMKAYEDAISKCSTEHAPWYVIPANKKWFRNIAVSDIIIETLESLKMKFPKPDFDPSTIVIP